MKYMYWKHTCQEKGYWLVVSFAEEKTQNKHTFLSHHTMKHTYEDTQKLLDTQKKNSNAGWSLSKPVLGFGILLLVAISALGWRTFHGSTISTGANFVTVDGAVFMNWDEQFLVGGVNVYNIVERLVASPDQARRALDTLSKDGVTVIRIFAHTTNQEYPMQLLENPREYNEEALKALDEILHVC